MPNTAANKEMKTKRLTMLTSKQYFSATQLLPINTNKILHFSFMKC